MRVYIAGPYSGSETSNIRAAILAAEDVVRLNHTPFVPHLCMHWQLMSLRTYDEWINYDLEWLAVCDVVLCIGASPGSDMEVAFAIDNNIPVYFTISELAKHEPTRTEDSPGSTRSDSTSFSHEED